VRGLKFYVLDCDCIYYQRVFREGNLDPEVAIYRDAKQGPCQACMALDESWKKRVIEESVVCMTVFEIG